MVGTPGPAEKLEAIWQGPRAQGGPSLQAPAGYSLTYGDAGAWVTVWQQMPRGKRAITTMATPGLTSDTLEKLIRV
mgnify:CR=1 FL=1